jgi:hypothetical protein
MSTKKKDNGDQVETSLEHPNINLEAQDAEKRRHAQQQPTDEEQERKNRESIRRSPNAPERIDDWEPERKAHAEKVGKAIADLYQFALDHPVIEGILSSKMTGVTSALSDPLVMFKDMGVELPERRDEIDIKDRRWEREQREQLGEIQRAY